MCACEPGYTCSRCAGTPFDPMYLLDEPDPVSDADFEQLVHEPSPHPIIMLGEDYLG